MSLVIVTEKPAVARDIAAVLGLRERGRHAIQGPGYTVTWAVGHLVTLAEPHQIRPAWKQWRTEDLPLLPDEWPLEVLEKTADQFAAVRQLLTAASTERVICATDAGREGELIFRYIYEKSGCRKPCERLWISSLTPEAIREGLARLRPLADYDGLADAARARSRADWLVGMNLSRAYSLSTGQNFSIGRVQTPTLAMLVERELEIRNFVPEDYVTLEAKFQALSGVTAYAATLCEDPEDDGKKAKTPKPKRFALGAPAIEDGLARLQRSQHHVHSLQEKPSRLPPPQFYDLTELQRHANRLWGFSAQRTLDLAQDLYEKFKLITYPRTDSRYVPKAMVPQIFAMVETLKQRYPEVKEHSFLIGRLGERYADDALVSDHHAIIPTGQGLQAALPAGDHGKLFEMICRRLVSAFLDDFQAMNSEVWIHSEPKDKSAEQEPWRELWNAKGRRILELGWKKLEDRRERLDDGNRDLPSELRLGQEQKLLEVKPEKRRTTPPPRLSDASLLTAMEHAGSKVKDKQLAAAMREHGLGTPATRSAIIETLIHRQYITRDKRLLLATDKAIRLIEAVTAEIKSPQLTGQWEFRMRLIQQGKERLEDFEADIRSFVRQMTQLGLANRLQAPAPKAWEPMAQTQPQALTDKAVQGEMLSPEASLQTLVSSARQDLSSILQQYFGFAQFRPHQEAVCRDLVQGRDVLLVMPTGAGKSLCYQLPGLALGRPTVVISPLIALMDDQVARLNALGIAAGAIHSGKARGESQELCRLYAQGALPFLFIAPERLGVPGFVPFLTQHKPGLIAIDEAHCISNWGHDFRYDYRRLKERLAPLRPAIIVAMTATATQRVQQDIVDQLSLPDPVRHVHGFRRTNIAIEHRELPRRERLDALWDIVRDPKMRPAIVYAPTRREAEQAAEELSSYVACAAYHAGMDAAKRTEVQTAFQKDRLDIIVATIAFGMGIDKPNVRTVVHLALPSSLEGYYQEIGRAGRDGKASRAVLLSSYADMKTQEYFLNRNYPDIRELRSLLRLIPPEGRPRQDFQNGEKEASLDRLLMIGALSQEHNGLILRKEDRSDWEKVYTEQRSHRQKQINEVLRFVENSARCRMLQLLDHFGDKDAQGAACGLCDVCVPSLRSAARKERPLDALELASAQKLWEYLQIEKDPVAVGRLYRDCGELLGVERRAFEQLLEAFAQAGDIQIEHASFQKGDERIEFRKVEALRSKPSVAWDDLRVAGAKTASRKTTQKSKAKTPKRQGAVALDQGLLEKLKVWRKGEAQKRKIPAYCILSDRSLEEIAEQVPRSREQLLTISGIGPVKGEQFGAKILELVGTR